MTREKFLAAAVRGADEPRPYPGTAGSQKELPVRSMQKCICASWHGLVANFGLLDDEWTDAMKTLAAAAILALAIMANDWITDFNTNLSWLSRAEQIQQPCDTPHDKSLICIDPQ